MGGPSLRTVFMGTPRFAVPVLSALLDAGHDVVGVFCQPDRPASRGRRLLAPPVKAYAAERGLPVFQPASLRRDGEARRQLASMAPDLIVVAAYGQLLPADILAIPRLDCLNVHPSLLPRYRGASPVASAILDGAAVTGVTVMKVDEGMDTGPIVASRETPIGPRETAEELTERLFGMGADLLVSLLPGWASGRLQASPQDGSQATVTRRLSRRDGEMDWTRSADYLARQILAYHPWPGSTTFWQGRRLKIVEARRADGAGPPPSPGEVAALEGGVGVGTGEGVLELKRVQLESRGVTTPEELARGHPGFVGSILGEPAEV